MKVFIPDNSAFGKLDAVLTLLNTEPIIQKSEAVAINMEDAIENARWKTAGQIMVALQKLGYSIDKNETRQALEYLILEKYIDTQERVAPNMLHYRITYAGRILIENGGYVNRSLISEFELKREKRLYSYASYGAYGAAIIALLYLLWDITKFGIQQHWFF